MLCLHHDIYHIHPHQAGHQLASRSAPTSGRPTSVLRSDPRGLRLLRFILPGAVDAPISPRDNDWWAGNRVKSLQSNIPTDLYYEPDFPNGQLWFWPIPNASYGVRLEGNVVLQQMLSLDDRFTAPQAYLRRGHPGRSPKSFVTSGARRCRQTSRGAP